MLHLRNVHGFENVFVSPTFMINTTPNVTMAYCSVTFHNHQSHKTKKTLILNQELNSSRLHGLANVPRYSFEVIVVDIEVAVIKFKLSFIPKSWDVKLLTG